MKRTSFRTFILLVELLAAVVAYQFLVWTPSAGAATVWLDDDPNDAVDPNQADDPQPESMGWASPMALDEDPNDPNTPDEGTNPQPEVAAIWCP